MFCLHWRFVEIIFRSKYPSSSFFFLTILIFPRREQESVNFQVVFHLAVCIRGIYSPREDTQRRRRGHKTGDLPPRAHEGSSSAKSNLRIFFSRWGARVFGRHLWTRDDTPARLSADFQLFQWSKFISHVIYNIMAGPYRERVERKGPIRAKSGGKNNLMWQD